MSASSPRAIRVIGAALGSLSLTVIAGLLIAALVTPAITVVGATVESTAGIFDSLPESIEIDRQREQNRIYATQDGAPVQIATTFDQNRESVAWDQVSEFAKIAAISGEDQRYYEHGGIDLQGIARAAVTNIAGGGIEEGASTITQQYVKNTFIQEALNLDTEEERDKAYELAIDPSFDRKVKEMKLAISLEKRYTKEEILLAYLNIANFGGNTYGIEAAAKRYFATTALNLTPAQAASLIAIVQSPGVLRLDYPENLPANQVRRDFILNMMLDDEGITREQYTEAVSTPLDATTVIITEPVQGCAAANDHARFFCDYVLNLIEDLPALGADETERTENFKRGGYEIYTSLDLGVQVPAQDISWQYADKNATALKLGSATVSVEVGTGRILVMAQNKDYDNTEDGAGSSATAVNFSTDRNYGGSSGFQPGSTYKVFTLLNWLQNDHGLNEVVDGSPRTVPSAAFTDSCGGPWFGPYPFKNDDSFGGQMTAATATQRSVNGAFISMALKLDLCEIKNTAESLGVHRADGKPLMTNPSSVLGTNEIAPLTMAAAYAGIASGGTFCDPIAVDRVVGPTGEQLPGQIANCRASLEPDVANTAAFAMSKVMTDGTGRTSNPNNGVQYIGKTGTTDSSNQTWMVGATTRVATAVWVGNIVNAVPLRSVRIGGLQASVIRHAIFKPTATVIDNTGSYRGGAFPGPAASLLDGTGKAVPNVTGESLDNARSILEATGFTVVDGGPVDSALPLGAINNSNPAAGSLVSLGSAVTVYTSNQSGGTMPDVVGNGMISAADARGSLAAQGFTNIAADYCVQLPADQLGRVGRVISTTPAAGTPTPASSSVAIGIGAPSC
ncbi:membrane peptidoglycan carboxypeptidase [Glaciihabitans tibetensis]|uniref:Membrane peptidoglycan carboxypeptidase n=1 Tax=Glaciihabitans tibetensis TaxID=1266600 RepID=A0A2T0VAK3_9MICO|nr:transglycosylase domain-containing protein [Glaciihabitans tibetensis]PRY67229.1 membrane peptidoglycan carboxypeptidase [Glaciihabitans tibetensis]